MSLSAKRLCGGSLSAKKWFEAERADSVAKTGIGDLRKLMGSSEDTCGWSVCLVWMKQQRVPYGQAPDSQNVLC